MYSKNKRHKKESWCGRLLKSVFSANSTKQDPAISTEESSADSADSIVQVRLEPNSEESKTQSLLKARDITTPVFTIGRRSGELGHAPCESELSIRQVEPYTLSRKHCAMELNADFVLVRDLGSQYGTLVNGTRIGGRNTEESTMKLERGTHALILGPRNSTVRFKLVIQ